MATRSEIKGNVKLVLCDEIKKVNEILINEKPTNNITIHKVEFVEPIVSYPDDIDKDDFEKASKIKFDNAIILVQFKVSEGVMVKDYFCNGTAEIKFANNDFVAEVQVHNCSPRFSFLV